MEARNYANVPVNRGMGEVRERSKILLLVGVSFLLVCIIQSALNIYFWQQQVGLSKVFNVSECNATLHSENYLRELAVKQRYVEEINQLKQEKAKLIKENNQTLKAVLEKNEERMKHLTEENRKLHDQIFTCETTVTARVCPPVPPLACPPVTAPVCPPPVPPPECPSVLPLVCPPMTHAVCSQVTSPVCPPGWHTLKGSCYWVSCEQSTWLDARTRCVSNGADLVSVNDETEWSFLSGLVGTSRTWIGLYVHHDIYSQTLMWVDGSTMTFRPNYDFYYGTNHGNCMYMESSQYSSSFCDQYHGWICEKKLGKKPYLRT